MALLGVSTAALIAGGTMTATAAPPDTGARAKPAGASQGEAKKASCPKGALCLYTGTKYTGKRIEVWGKSNKNHKHISSMWNNGDTGEAKDHVKVKRYNNKWVCMKPGTGRTGDDYTVDAVRWAKSC